MGYSNVFNENNIRYKFFQVAKTACKKWGVPVLDLWDGSALNPKLGSMYDPAKTPTENIDGGMIYTDGQHLTPTGYDLITAKIDDWMKTL